MSMTTVVMMVMSRVITVETFADNLNVGASSFSRVLDRINNVRGVDL